MIIIDEKKIFDVIETRKPTSVALNGPDGLLPKVQDLALKIGKILIEAGYNPHFVSKGYAGIIKNNTLQLYKLDI